ncbi:lipa and NB-ARC domain protein [Aspergillus parasiticus]|uniref:Lipa and NB-ARC domain protein n=1 Tax=Aspergillus parasiticus TaxID=5067 RepID=A0A5N6DCG2_ASPPA|nr:lipa and NB-ARC domain protein [Aspergillus parasiticus]
MPELAARVKQIGLTQVYCSKEKPLVDIVLVHGLNGHPYNTWATQGNPPVFWPADLLPEVLESSRVRILTYGYNANVASFTDGASRDRIHHHAETLASGLAANRNLRSCSDRPIIFVCHSLGGLVVKRALIYCKNVSDAKIQHLRSIYVSTYGILFLGTPHNGSDIAKWGLLLQNICSAVLPKKYMESSSQLVKALRTNNETLQNINSLFADMMSRYHIYFFHETLSTDVKGTRELIVDESSAAPYAEGVERMGIEADHRHMCKFEDDNAPGYEAVAEALLRYSRDAPATILDRWAEEEQTRRAATQNKLKDLLRNERPDSTSQMEGSEPDLRKIGRTQFLPANTSATSSVTMREYEVEEPPEHLYASNTVPPLISLPPNTGRQSPVSDMAGSVILTVPQRELFVVPPGFHPNASFFGMQKELEVLHSRLYKAKNRAERLMAVLVCGVPGSGKSHLARQYVWSQRKTYPGGVFWVDAKTRESTAKCFWDIAQAAMLTEAQDLQQPQKYVEAVRNWLQIREEWLLIFDGISFDHDDDLNNFRQFLPFNKNCSIIYTSVDKTLRKKQRLYEPYCLQIKPLQVEDACKLLFKDLGIRKPTPSQIRKATELVNHYECLPLAIHAISHRLSATSKSIDKYHVNSHLTDEKLAEPFLSIMHDLYRMGHFEALNLINILSFFGHHVPVGLINLGKAALETWHVDILTGSRPGEQGDIDTTLGILIRYGLIERHTDAYALHPKALSPRSEKDEILDIAAVAPDLSESQTESSQDASFSVYQSSGSIDLIKIHSVVQGFCRDELKIMDEERRRSFTTNATKSDAGFYDSWLVVATRVFCMSYEHAKKRMDRLDDYGLVKDYREYEMHASRLLDNFPKKSSKEPKILREVRDDLGQVMRSINNEIEKISPSSSQESVRKQRSVFDRSSSSSSSAPESATDEGPSRTLTWEFSDMVERKAESPEEMPMSPPHFNLKPFLPHIFRWSKGDDEKGYESDREGLQAIHRTSPALSQVSQATERPKSSRSSSAAHTTDDQEWQVVEKSPRLKASRDRRPKQRPKFPRSAWGIKPAAPVLRIFPVEGRSASSSILEKGSRSSSIISASEALTAVHNASPPSAHEKFGKAVNDRLMLHKENVPTYATVAARRTQDGVASSKQRSSSTPGGQTRPKLLRLKSKSSGGSLHSRLGNAPLLSLPPDPKSDPMSRSTYSEPDQAYFTHQLNALDLRTPHDSRYRSRHLSTVRAMGAVDMSASTPSVLTYLPPLPYDNNIEVSYSRRVSATTQAAPVSQPLASFNPITHPSAIMPGASPPPSVAAEAPTGYASDPAPEPMSRGGSAQSHQSWATEPVRYPPRLSPMPSNAQTAIPPGMSHILPQQQTLANAGSWIRDAHTQGIASALQADIITCAPPTQANLRPIPPLDERLGAGTAWDPEPPPTLHFGAHRVDVRDARQRLEGYGVYGTQTVQHAIPYSLYHANRSGPLVHHELGLQPQELHGMRARSGSSPTRPGSDGLGVNW